MNATITARIDSIFRERFERYIPVDADYEPVHETQKQPIRRMKHKNMDDTVSVRASTLPAGWTWVHKDDGSGALYGPNQKAYFGFDFEPYKQCENIRYKTKAFSKKSAFTGTFAEFARFAEAYINENMLGTRITC